MWTEKWSRTEQKSHPNNMGTLAAKGRSRKMLPFGEWGNNRWCGKRMSAKSNAVLVSVFSIKAVSQFL